MNIEEFRNYCITKPGTTEEFPFGPQTLVFKVMGKMFALTDVDSYGFINLKCDPDKTIDLREQFDGITPGYHMNKKLWNSVSTDGTIGNKLMFELIDHSYDLIVASLPKKLKAQLETL
ncbi:MAG: MmcQ/YjbR family DNA-binding protein [Cyclobacteriaceae bacterium]